MNAHTSWWTRYWRFLFAVDGGRYTDLVIYLIAQDLLRKMPQDWVRGPETHLQVRCAIRALEELRDGCKPSAIV